MADLPTELRTLVQRYGSHVLDDPDGLRATLDDFLDEDANPGDVNLLVDAVRFGALDRLKTLLDQGAEPAAAMVDVAEALAQRRGGDAESAYWACAVLGYAADLLPGDLIPGSWERPSSLFPPSHPAVGATSSPPSRSSGEAIEDDAETQLRSSTDNSHTGRSEGADATLAPPPASNGNDPAAGRSAPPPSGERSRRRGVLIAAAVVLALLVVGGAVWWQQRDDDSTPEAAAHDPGAHDPDMSSPAVSLPDSVHAANEAKPGLLPVETCHTQDDDHFACAHVNGGVDTLDLKTFMSRSDLYQEYSAKVASLNHGKPVENEDDCNVKMTGEASWNHIGEHSHKYSLAEVASGELGDDEAVGRVFCVEQRGVLKLVWTDNNIRMLGYMTGQPHAQTYNWWRNEHHHFDVSMSDDSSSDMDH